MILYTRKLRLKDIMFVLVQYHIASEDSPQALCLQCVYCSTEASAHISIHLH